MVAEEMSILLFVVVIIACVFWPHRVKGRRGIVRGQLTRDNGVEYEFVALVEEMENLGTASIVRVLSISGVPSYYQREAKCVIGKVLEHDSIEWVS
jgi:hypothetical protein